MTSRNPLFEDQKTRSKELQHRSSAQKENGTQSKNWIACKILQNNASPLGKQGLSKRLN